MFEHQSEEKQKQIIKLTPESFKLFNIENVEKGKQKMSLVLSSDAIWSVNLILKIYTFAVLKTTFLQSGRMLMDQGGKL